MSKDDDFWLETMEALADEFINVGRASKDRKVADTWVAAGKEVRATARQAHRTSTTAERLVQGGNA